MTGRPDIAPLQATLTELLAATAAGRVTLRIDRPEAGWHVDEPAVEALAPDVPSIKGTPGLDQRSLATVAHIDRTRRILVQDDCRGADPAPPPALLDVYGVRAQMLAPIVEDGTMTGWISVHDTTRPRTWEAADVDAIAHAVELVAAALEDPASGRSPR